MQSTPGGAELMQTKPNVRQLVERFLKRSFDLFFSTMLLILLSPLFIVIALAIMIDSGRPAFFVQDRLGLRGATFRMVKFRTMTPGSDKTTPLNEDGSLKTTAADPRITRVGAFLRRTSLDELPQLINVARGEMSLVGPRPDLPFHLQFYSQTSQRKLSVRPGITGLAQVSGRNEILWEQRLAYDVEYVEKQSLLLDLKILLLTVGQVIGSRGVYQSHTKNVRDRGLTQ